VIFGRILRRKRLAADGQAHQCHLIGVGADALCLGGTMSRIYLKKATRTATSDAADVHETVRGILEAIEAGGDAAALDFARRFDRYEGAVLLSPEQIEAACAQVPETLKADIRFAHDNVRRFAEMQKSTVRDVELEIAPGFVAGQKAIPVDAAGCYVPGGRYSHIASAIMTVTTAKVAGVRHITACSPPRPDVGVAPAIVYAAHICGADQILAMGGVQGVAAMTFGLFGLPRANILVGPGNQYVAEAKRILFGRVGIDMIAGPTDSLILADGSADPLVVATDLVSQAEHGYNSPVWLVTDDRALAEAVMQLVPGLIADLPPLNRENAEAAWRDYAEVILCADRAEMAACSDEYAPEHLTVQAQDLEWWFDRLTCYGALFLGEETTVSYGDKAAGTNHVLPTSGAASYTGGLSVHKYMKIVTWQRATREGARQVAQTTARLSRLEGMEGHARAADVRLAKYFPNESFDLQAHG
jgi:sulfopropanediol 3-dehydrogenase